MPRTSIRRIVASLTLGSMFLPVAIISAKATCYDWPLRERHGEYAYDGDTIYVNIPDLPGEIAEMSVRVRGVDTPEIRAKCKTEKSLASKARDFARQSLKSAKRVEFCEPEWGRYGGRIVASVRIDGRALDQELINQGFARPYDGKTKRQPWCQG